MCLGFCANLPVIILLSYLLRDQGALDNILFWNDFYLPIAVGVTLIPRWGDSDPPLG